mgnify:CR=1 FL=1
MMFDFLFNENRTNELEKEIFQCVSVRDRSVDLPLRSLTERWLVADDRSLAGLESLQ